MVRWQPSSRNRLEAAAISLFAEQGYDRTTVAGIAARAGVTERTFYRHFDVKREVLFSEAAFLEALLVDVVDAAPIGSPPMAIVLAALDVVVELLGQRPDHAVQRHTVITATPELHERELIKMASLGGALADAMRARGVPSLTADLAAATGITVFRVAYERWVLDPQTEDFGAAVRESLAALRSATALP